LNIDIIFYYCIEVSSCIGCKFFVFSDNVHYVINKGLTFWFFGAKRGNETWRRRYNYELYETFSEPNVVNYKF